MDIKLTGPSVKKCNSEDTRKRPSTIASTALSVTLQTVSGLGNTFQTLVGHPSMKDNKESLEHQARERRYRPQKRERNWFLEDSSSTRDKNP